MMTQLSEPKMDCPLCKTLSKRCSGHLLAQVTRQPRGFHSVFCLHERHLAAISLPPPLTDLVLVLQPSRHAHLRSNHPSKH